MQKSFSSSKISSPQLLVAGFLVTIIIGAGLLMLPYATTNGITLVDAVFTSASSVCVTGLIVKNTPVDFTTFGKIVIMALIQIGGLGYMSMATFFALLAGKKIGISQRILIKDSLNTATHEGVIKFIKGMLLFVIVAEGLGAVTLYYNFFNQYHLETPVLQSVFHSISAFNNAGFSLFETSLMDYRGDIPVNFIITSLIIFGGIGFTVVYDLYGWFMKKEKRLMLHTRIVLVTSAALITAGALLIYLTESKFIFKQAGFSEAEMIMSSLFAAVTARTAGFSTIDYSLLQHTTLLITMILMFIGASPGSTGGGIKTTTFSVIIMNLWATIRGRKDTVAFNRRIPEDIISRSLVVLSLSSIYVIIATIIIIHIEHTYVITTLFEVVSAFATTGLSVGDGGARSLCANFSDLSKSIIIVTMFIGRLGPLTLFMALIQQKEQHVRYPEGRVMIG